MSSFYFDNSGTYDPDWGNSSNWWDGPAGASGANWQGGSLPGPSDDCHLGTYSWSAPSIGSGDEPVSIYSSDIAGLTNNGTLTVGSCTGTLTNYGTLAEGCGTFSGEVVNYGTVDDGTFTTSFQNNGTVYGGCFTAEFYGSGGDAIYGGVFDVDYFACGYVYGGYFTGSGYSGFANYGATTWVISGSYSVVGSQSGMVYYSITGSGNPNPGFSYVMVNVMYFNAVNSPYWDDPDNWFYDSAGTSDTGGVPASGMNVAAVDATPGNATISNIATVDLGSGTASLNSIDNFGQILSGTFFLDVVTNESGATISGGTFSGTLSNNGGVITGGSFTANNITNQQAAAALGLGAGAIQFDGVTGFVQAGEVGAWAWGDGDFAIEFFLWLNVNTGPCPLISLGQGPNGNAPTTCTWSLYAEDGTLYFERYDGVSDYQISWAASLQANTPYFIQVMRSQGVINLYVNASPFDGGQSDTTEYSLVSDDNLYIGIINVTYEGESTVWNLNGYMDEIRMSRCVRPVGVPGVEFVSDASTVLLMHCDTDFSDSSPLNCDPSPYDGAVISSTLSGVPTIAGGAFSASGEFTNLARAQITGGAVTGWLLLNSPLATISGGSFDLSYIYNGGLIEAGAFTASAGFANNDGGGVAGTIAGGWFYNSVNGASWLQGASGPITGGTWVNYGSVFVDGVFLEGNDGLANPGFPHTLNVDYAGMIPSSSVVSSAYVLYPHATFTGGPTGQVNLPSTSNVLLGVNRGDGQIGVCYMPNTDGLGSINAAAVISAAHFGPHNSTQGTCVLPAVGNVLKGVNRGDNTYGTYYPPNTDGNGTVNAGAVSTTAHFGATNATAGTLDLTTYVLKTALPAVTNVLKGVNRGDGSVGTYYPPSSDGSGTANAGVVLVSAHFGAANATQGTYYPPSANGSGTPDASTVSTLAHFGVANATQGTLNIASLEAAAATTQQQTDQGIVAGHAGDIRNGTTVLAATGTCYVPTANTVAYGVHVDNTTGTRTDAPEADVLTGVTYGNPGNLFTGSLSGGGLSDAQAAQLAAIAAVQPDNKPVVDVSGNVRAVDSSGNALAAQATLTNSTTGLAAIQAMLANSTSGLGTMSTMLSQLLTAAGNLNNLSALANLLGANQVVVPSTGTTPYTYILTLKSDSGQNTDPINGAIVTVTASDVNGNSLGTATGTFATGGTWSAGPTYTGHLSGLTWVSQGRFAVTYTAASTDPVSVAGMLHAKVSAVSADNQPREADLPGGFAILDVNSLTAMASILSILQRFQFTGSTGSQAVVSDPTAKIGSLATSAEANAIIAKTSLIGTNAGDSPNAATAQTAVAAVALAVDALGTPNASDFTGAFPASVFANIPVTPLGPGGISVAIVVKDISGNPLADIASWMTSDSAGARTIAGTLDTNSLGAVAFMLDAGVNYLWRMSPTYGFPNPQAITVEGSSMSITFADGTAIAGPASGYAVRSDLENIFGVPNIIKWAILSQNDPDSPAGLAEITARINWAISVATADFENAMRQGRYTLPITGTGASVWATTVVATLAGLLLYQHLKPTQRDQDGRPIPDRYDGIFTWAEQQMNFVRSGKLRLDAAVFGKGTNAPEATHERSRGAYGPGMGGYGTGPFPPPGPFVG